jgi:hypothetical protein
MLLMAVIRGCLFIITIAKFIIHNKMFIKHQFKLFLLIHNNKVMAKKFHGHVIIRVAISSEIR